jgi:hypothetical protein
MAQVIAGSFIVPAMFNAVLFTEKKKDETYPGFMARALTLQAASTVPFLNSAMQMVLEGQRPRDPWTSFISTFWQVFKDTAHYAQGERTSEQYLRGLINLPGLMFGLPTGQIAKTTQFLNDVQKRKQNPRNFWEWMHGLRTGRAREK